jgi:hypothetical protein
MARHSFIQMSKLSNVREEISYISDPKRRNTFTPLLHKGRYDLLGRAGEGVSRGIQTLRD